MEQLTALEDVLDRDVAPHEEFAVLGATREPATAQAAAFRLSNVDLLGPATFDTWKQAYQCLLTGLVSWSAVSLGRRQF